MVASSLSPQVVNEKLQPRTGLGQAQQEGAVVLDGLQEHIDVRWVCAFHVQEQGVVCRLNKLSKIARTHTVPAQVTFSRVPRKRLPFTTTSMFWKVARMSPAAFIGEKSARHLEH